MATFNISFEGVIKGIPDFQPLLYGRKYYKQEAIFRGFGMNYNAHDALEDCRVVASLTDHYHVSHHIMNDYRFMYD